MRTTSLVTCRAAPAEHITETSSEAPPGGRSYCLSMTAATAHLSTGHRRYKVDSRSYSDAHYRADRDSTPGDFLLGNQRSSHRLVFPNNQIPANRISSITNTILQKWVPLPNNGTGTLNWYANFPATLSGLYTNWRIDQRISSKDSIFGHYLFNDTAYNWAKTFPTDGTTDNTRGQNVVVHWTHILGSRTLNDFHIGYSRFFETEFEIREGTGNVVQELGITGLCEMPGCWGIPQENVTGYQFFGEHGGVQPRSGPRGWSNQFYQLQDSFSHQSGPHSMSFGLASTRTSITSFR